MKPSIIKVLSALRCNKRKGITFDDFRTGFRLAAVIFDLRELGYEIITHKEAISNGRNIARYVLIKERKGE